MLFTVFTPTYNRAHTLPRLYESIRRQTLRDFEWVVVDDGSTDATRALVTDWQKVADFPIRYFWQPNQHKKVAFNRGVREARGKWFVPIDSDDELLPDALSRFEAMWNSIDEGQRERFVAVVGLCLDVQGRMVGDSFPSSPLDASAVELFFDYQVTGEKFGCLRTDVLREFPFPEDIPDLVPENVVWFRMARRYTQRCFNVPVRIYHRDVESITLPKDATAARKRRAQGALLSYAEALDWVTFRRFARAPHKALFLALQYGRWLSYLPPDRRRFTPQRLGPKTLAALVRPAGWLLYWMDKSDLTTRVREALGKVGLRFW